MNNNLNELIDEYNRGKVQWMEDRAMVEGLKGECERLVGEN